MIYERWGFRQFSMRPFQVSSKGTLIKGVLTVKSWSYKHQEELNAYERELKSEYETKLETERQNFKGRQEEFEKEMEELQKKSMDIIRKRNYELNYPTPEKLQEHLNQHKNSFNIQGKSELLLLVKHKRLLYQFSSRFKRSG